MDRPLSERLDARAAFEDKRVMDEARAMGFVPEVYTGSQTGALLREAAEFARRVEEAPPAIMDTREFLGLCAPTEDDFPALYALQGQRVRLVPEAGQGVGNAVGEMRRQPPP